MKNSSALMVFMIFLFLFTFSACNAGGSESGVSPEAYEIEMIPEGKVIPIPQSIVDKFELDTKFYKKMLSSGGLPIMGSDKVDDKAFHRADELVKKLLAGRKDILDEMVNGGVRLVIIAAEEGASEVPEYYLDDPQARAYQDERVRGYGGRMTSFGEENLLCLPIDRYDDENIMIHEFGGHCVDSTVSRMDRDFRRELRRLYRDAIGRGLYKDTYAGTNQAEYWAEAVQDYFDADRQNNWNHNYVNTREELLEYDPNMCEFVARVFNLSPEQDWRYKPVAVQPAVTTPPEKLKADKFYTKYVDCRSLPVMGSAKASDEALLKANQLIRNMFTYRHDILKTMIDKGLRVVVLAEDQNINVVPECALLSSTGRRLTIEKPEFRIVIGQDYILTPEKYGENMLVREFAKAIVTNVANRPFDPNFEEISDRRKQQYELYGVVPVDERFAKKLDELYNDAKEKGLWKGTPAQTNAVKYFAEGLQSWFDCNSNVKDSAGKTINTRAELKEYDPALAEFIADTFKHTQREGFDWRCTTSTAEAGKKNKASEYLEKLSAATKKLENYQCRISYLHAQPLFETKSLRKGELYYKKDGRKSFLRINFETLKEDDDAEQKYRDEWIFDGRWLTHIDYKVKQVKRTEQADEGEEIDAFELIRQSFPIIGFTKVEELQEQFETGKPEVFSTKAGDFVRLDLRPKAGTDYAEDYKSIELQINSQLDLPYRITAVSTEPEDESDYYEIELTKAEIDREIDRKIFEFEIPQGFTVETQRLEERES